MSNHDQNPSPKESPQAQFPTWAKMAFTGLTREELDQAADLIGITIHNRTSDENARLKLCEAMGMVEGRMSGQQVEDIKAAAPVKAKLTDKPPNLSPSGKWGGRHRRVKLVHTERTKDFVAFPFSWEGAIKYFHFDTEVDMPWPYFQSLSSMRETHINQELTRDGRSVNRTETTSMAVPFSDMGDTPGTENLPCSMIEYVRRVADTEKNFAKTERKDLVRVMRWLHGPSANTSTKDMSDDDIRDALLSFIGVDIYADAA